MASTMLLGYQNVILTATLAAGSEAAGLGVSNLQSDQGNSATAWQTIAGTTTSYMTADSGSTSTGWRLVSGHGTNLTTGTTVRVRISNSSTFATTVYDTGTVSAGILVGYRQFVVVLPAGTVGQYLRVDITDTGNSDGFLNIPLMYAGPALNPVRNWDYASVPGRSSQTVKSGTRSGGVFIRNEWNKRTFDLSMQGVDRNDVPAILAADLYGRQGNNVLFVPNYSSSAINQDALFGEFEPQSGIGYPAKGPFIRSYRAILTERL